MYFILTAIAGSACFIIFALRVNRKFRIKKEESRLEAEASARRRKSKIDPFFSVLAQENILHTRSQVLEYVTEGIRHSSHLVGRSQAGKGLRAVLPFGIQEMHFSEPTGWGDWSWTEFAFAPESCPSCQGVTAILCRLRTYRLDPGDGIGPQKLATLCMECLEVFGTDGIKEDDVPFIHQCQDAARRASVLPSLKAGPYRSAA